jgi:hypothetical protein
VQPAGTLKVREEALHDDEPLAQGGLSR